MASRLVLQTNVQARENKGITLMTQTLPYVGMFHTHAFATQWLHLIEHKNTI